MDFDFQSYFFRMSLKKLSLEHATVKQKIGRCIYTRRVSNSSGFEFGHELNDVQLKMCLSLMAGSGRRVFRWGSMSDI